jgi:hypothetical protein
MQERHARMEKRLAKLKESANGQGQAPELDLGKLPMPEA